MKKTLLLLAAAMFIAPTITPASAGNHHHHHDWQDPTPRPTDPSRFAKLYTSAQCTTVSTGSAPYSCSSPLVAITASPWLKKTCLFVTDVTFTNSLTAPAGHPGTVTLSGFHADGTTAYSVPFRIDPSPSYGRSFNSPLIFGVGALNFSADVVDGITATITGYYDNCPLN